MPEKHHALGIELYELAHTAATPKLRAAYLKAASALFVAARDLEALQGVILEERRATCSGRPRGALKFATSSNGADRRCNATDRETAQP
jgi:hypothetical protein